jgi:hypothetical protein
MIFESIEMDQEFASDV